VQWNSGKLEHWEHPQPLHSHWQCERHLRQYLRWYLLEIRLTTSICVACCKSPSRFQKAVFFLLTVYLSCIHSLQEEKVWVILLMKDVCVLLAASCLMEARALVFILPPHCGRGSQVWCHDTGLAHPHVSRTDLNALGWRSGNQWSIGQIIENLGTRPTPTRAAESLLFLLLTSVGDRFSVLFSKCCMVSADKCLAVHGCV